MSLQTSKRCGESIDLEATLLIQNQRSALKHHSEWKYFHMGNWIYLYFILRYYFCKAKNEPVYTNNQRCLKKYFIHLLKGYLCFKILCKQYIGSLNVPMDYSPLTTFMKILETLSWTQSNLISDIPSKILPWP